MPQSAGIQFLDTPCGVPLEIHADRHAVSAVFFQLERKQLPPERPNALTRKTARQLREYFAGTRQDFSLPLTPLGQASTYRRGVWRALQDIPYGQTRTYTEVAHRAGGNARSVGTANGRNPLCVVVPCHRVVRKDGSVGGYGGPLIRTQGAQLLDIKRFLLEHERQHA